MYGRTQHVGAPPEMYPKVHAAVLDLVREQGGGDGLVLHLARPTEQGFDVVEVWESREQAEAFDRNVLKLALERAGAEDRPAPTTEEFEPLGVMVPTQSGTAADVQVGGG